MNDKKKKKTKLKLKIFNKKKRSTDKKSLKTKKNMEKLRTTKVNGKKIAKKIDNNENKKLFIPFLIFLIGFGLLVFAISYSLFDTLVALGLFAIYIVIVLFTQVLDLTTRTSKIRKLIKTLCILCFIFGIIGVLAFVAFFTYIVLESPEFDVDNLKMKESTLVYDNKNNLIATLGDEKREEVTYDELPEVLIDAIIATEDSRFFQHNGFDAPRFAKAAVGQLMGKDAGGGSTLTMQISKNRFSSTDVSLTRKFTDIYLSIFKIEKAYTKQEIIEFYVNTPYLGNYSYGVEQACQSYFNKSASEINLSEAALIAGLFQAPTGYDPTINPYNAYERRETVLNLMVRHGYITEEEMEMANSIKIGDLLKKSSASSNPYQGYLDLVANEIEKETGLNPYSYPMIVYTNMDKKMQEGINDILSGKTYKWPNKTIQAGVAVVDSDTGKILAIGAGRNITGERVFSYATDINRQIGSTAKPLFDYGPGIEYENWSTGKIFDDRRVSYSGSYMSNFDGRFLGKITLRYSLRDSRNVPALLAFREVDNDKILEFVTSLGIQPEVDSTGWLHEAHAVGAFNGSNPLTMAGAYAAFSNGGYHYDTYSVNKIVLRDSGETLTFKSTKEKVMSEATAYMITDVLTGVAADSGIRNAAGVAVACKTGTTNYDSQTQELYGYPSTADPDAWIAGYSSETAMVLWTGYNENKKGVYIEHDKMYLHRNNLYKALSKVVYNGSGSANFKKPSSVVSVTLEKGTEMLPSEYTPAKEKVTELFKRGTEPTDVSQKYVPLDNVTNLSMQNNDGTITLSWSAAKKANEKLLNVDKPGEFGYFIYKDNKELGFTTDLSYTYTSSNTYGTYKVVTGYKNMKTNRSTGASISLDLNVTFTYNDTLTENIAVGGTYTISTNPISVFKDGVDITSESTITTKIINTATNSEVTTIDTSVPGTYNVVYTATYLSKKETYIKTITIS